MHVPVQHLPLWVEMYDILYLMHKNSLPNIHCLFFRK
jgi:hypothetical protein